VASEEANALRNRVVEIGFAMMQRTVQKVPARWIHRWLEGNWVVGCDFEALVLPEGGMSDHLLPFFGYLTVREVLVRIVFALS